MAVNDDLAANAMVHVTVCDVGGETLAAFDIAVTANAFECKRHVQGLSSSDDQCREASLVLGSRVLLESETLLEALSSVGQAHSRCIELMLVELDRVEEMRRFFQGPFRQYLLDPNAGPTEHRRFRTELHQRLDWQQRKSEQGEIAAQIESAKAALTAAEDRLQLPAAARGYWHTDTQKERHALKKAECGQARLDHLFPFDDPALSWLLSDADARAQDPEKQEKAAACEWVYIHVVELLEFYDEEESEFEQSAWLELTQLSLPELRREDSESAGQITLSQDGRAAQVCAARDGSSMTRKVYPRLLYGLSPTMWRTFPIIRDCGHGGEPVLYFVHCMCRWRARATQSSLGGYIPWSPPSDVNFTPNAIEQVGRIFAHYVQLRLAIHGGDRKYASMPCSFVCPFAQFRRSSSTEDAIKEDAEIRQEVFERQRALLDRMGLSVTDGAFFKVVQDPIARDYSSDGEEETDRAGRGNDGSVLAETLSNAEVSRMRDLVWKMMPHSPNGIQSLRADSVSELRRKFSSAYPAFTGFLPTSWNANPGGAEGLTALFETAAARGMTELRIVITEVTESHGDNWCVEGDTPIAVIDENASENDPPALRWRRADELRAGDCVAVAGDIARPARLVATIRSEINSPLFMCHLSPGPANDGPGVWITHEHPAWKSLPDDRPGVSADAAAGMLGVAASERWQAPACFVKPVARTVTEVYNFVMDAGHVLNAGGVDIVTLAHGFDCTELAHPFWGTDLCLQMLRQARGWPDVVLSSDDSRRLQEIGEAVGGGSARRNFSS